MTQKSVNLVDKSHCQEMADEFTTLIFPNTKRTESGSWTLSLICSVEVVECLVLGNGSILDSDLGKYSILTTFHK
jgi:hypothetical protein